MKRLYFRFGRTCLCAFILILLSMPLVLTAAESNYRCDVSQGFHFEKNNQNLVGFITRIKIGKQVFYADLSVTNPGDISQTVKTFGVLSDIKWMGGYADPILMEARVSTDNKNKLATLLHQTLSNTEVWFSFVVFDYDPKEKRCYPAFHNAGIPLRGYILKSGSELDISIDQHQAMEVVSPKNFAFTIGIMPQDIQQTIHIAVSMNDKFRKAWGMNVSAMLLNDRPEHGVMD